MSPLEPRCPDCGRPVPDADLCAACEQDRAMQEAQLPQSGYAGKGLYCID